MFPTPINTFLGMPANAAEHGFLIDMMLEFCHWFMLILFVGWGSFFLYMLWRFRASKNPVADPKGMKSKWSTHAELSIVVVEAFILLGFAIPLWNMRVLDAPPAGSLEVKVYAKQFNFISQYPGTDGKFGTNNPDLIDGSNEIGLDRSSEGGADDIVIKDFIIPVNQPVVVHLGAMDVIHNFALVHMRMAQDAIPGMSIPFWFTPITTGDYEIICGQLCGSGHYAMKGITIVLNEDEFYEELKGKAKLQKVEYLTPAEVEEKKAAEEPEAEANATEVKDSSLATSASL